MKCVTQEEFVTRTNSNGRQQGYFCTDVVFNLSHKVLADLEISVLGKELGSSPTLTFINEADLKRDFVGFARKMSSKWFFAKKLRMTLLKFQHSNFSKSNWSPSKGHPALEIFLSQMEGEIF